MTFSKHWRVGAGSQTGSDLFNALPKLVIFNYGNVLYSSKNEKLETNVGVYYGNSAYVRDGNKAGVMFGGEYEFVEHFAIVGDCILGKNAISKAVLGFSYLPNDLLEVSLGCGSSP